jgi:hypothetical protein
LEGVWSVLSDLNIGIGRFEISAEIVEGKSSFGGKHGIAKLKFGQIARCHTSVITKAVQDLGDKVATECPW